MSKLARVSLALFLAALLGPIIAPSARAVLVDDLGVRKGKPVHIELSTGFNGVVGAGIKSLRVDGVVMDGFCIDPFTRALSSSSGYSFVPLTQAPGAPWTLTANEATQISDLWAMFYSPDMKKKKAAGLQIAIWEIVGGDDFSVVGKSYGARKMLAALGGFSGQGADLIALTGPGQDYVVPTPPRHGGGEGTPTPSPTHPPGLSTPTPGPTSTPTPAPTRPPGPTPTPPQGPTPPPNKVPDSGSTFPLFAAAILVLLALNTPCVPAVVRLREKRSDVSKKTVGNPASLRDL
jgi:hypothetical protein